MTILVTGATGKMAQHLAARPFVRWFTPRRGTGDGGVTLLAFPKGKK